MKTINVPLIGSCPQWVDDISPSQTAQFRVLVDRVQQDVLNSASRGMVTKEDSLKWHADLFSAFVPMAYYAGFFRGVDPARPCLAVDVGVGGQAGALLPGSDHRVVREQMSKYFEEVRLQLSDLELRWPQLSPSDRAIQLALIIANLVGVFIRVHPFVNGNGRTSRLLWRWSLLRFGVPPQCCTAPRPNPPYAQLMDAAMKGDYRPLALYVLGHLNSHSPVRN